MSLPLKRTSILSLFTRFLKYDIVGVVTFILDLVLIHILSKFTDLSALWIVGLAFTFAASLNYSINRYWSFRQSDRHPVVGYWYFLVILFIMSLITIAGTNFLLAETSWSLLMVRVLVATPVGVLNFLAQSYITFRII